MNVHFSSAKDNWETPTDFFEKLNQEFHFTLDVAADEKNHKCKRYFTKEIDGLAQSWAGEIVWCNPPYGRIYPPKFVRKLADGSAKIAVALLPARTDTRWFHDHILGKAEIRFLRGRIKFVGAKHGAPFPSMICIWRKA